MSVARQNVDKLRGIVTLNQFGAAGDGVTDDTAAIQAALNSGAKIVLGVQGSTYLVSHTGTFTAFTATAMRFCVQIPAGVMLDLCGATMKLANAQNSSILATYNTTGASILNAVLDGNRANQTQPATGDMAGIIAYQTTRLTLENIRMTDMRQYAGRFLGHTQSVIRNLRCVGVDGDGWAFGIGDYEAIDCQIDDIYAENCLKNYPNSGAPTQEGNGIIGAFIRCQSGRMIQKNCGGGIKIQDTSAYSSFEALTSIGPTNGSGNSGVKVQGNLTLSPVGINIGSITSLNNYGYGLYLYDCQSVQIANYVGSGNGQGAASTGSEKYDAYLQGKTAGRIHIGNMDVQLSATNGVVTALGGSIFIDNLNVRNPTGVGVFHSGSSDQELYIGVCRVTGSGVTNAVKVTGGKGRIDELITDRLHNVSTANIPILVNGISALTDPIAQFTIGRVKLGTNLEPSGVVQLTNAATETDVVNENIFRFYTGTVAAADTYFMPVISVEPWNASAAALGEMRALPNRGDTAISPTGTGFKIFHAAAGASDYVYWSVVDWQIVARAPS